MWPTLLPILGKLLDQVLPDAQAAQDAKLRAFELAQKGELEALNAQVQIATAQTEVNKIEAGSNSLFVAGWRPFVGWLCAFSLGFKYIGGPLLVMAAQYAGHHVTLPNVGTDDLMVLLAGMLGLGALRTVEKVKGAA